MNLPNKLTLTRILLVPVFMIFVSLGQYITPSYNPRYYLIAGLIFAVASFTDFLDGHLARKWNMVTDFASADRWPTSCCDGAFITATMRDGVCQSMVSPASFWPASSCLQPSAWWPTGQCKRTAKVIEPPCRAGEDRGQMLTIIFYYFTVSLTGNVLGQQCADIASVLCWVVAAVTAISGIKYLWDNRSFINTAK